MPPQLHVALIEPEIAPNTGNIGRLCLGIGARLHLVHPLGFRTDEKAVRRAGLDYWKHVDLVEHSGLAAFEAWAADRTLISMSSHGHHPYTEAPFVEGAVLVFGRESVGLPASWTSHHPCWRIPMTGAVRSLNLANAVAVVAYHALHRLDPRWFSAGSGSAGGPEAVHG